MDLKIYLKSYKDPHLENLITHCLPKYQLFSETTILLATLRNTNPFAKKEYPQNKKEKKNKN